MHCQRSELSIRWEFTAALVLMAIALFPCRPLAASPREGKPYETAGWVGTNYTPAFCVNAVQLWHDFRPDVIEKELAAARKHFGLTTLRVYLHNIPYDAEKEEFLERIEQFLVICHRLGIKPGFVFFDDCWNRRGVALESPPPIKGRHNGRWAVCPQDGQRTEKKLPELQAYVQDVIREHRHDQRVLWWEIFNEPRMKSDYSVKLRKLGYQWAKEVEPIQPVICCWNDSSETDIVDAHNYGNNFAAWDKQIELNPEKGAVFTEAGARWFAPRPSNGEPVEVIHWLNARKAAGKYVPGVYLCWELMVGNSNCRWYWGTKDGTPEPTIPWCGLIFRVNDPGPGDDRMRGYYVGFDTERLYLGKINNNWQPLASYDLKKLECKVAPGRWNMVRIAAEGPRIRVWMNRMHHDDGLRIDFTDENDPILSGNVGVRTHRVEAWFDNVIVLPSTAR